MRMLKYGFNLPDEGLVGQQLFAGEATRLAYGTEEAKEGRDAFLEKRRPDFTRYPWHLLTTTFGPRHDQSAQSRLTPTSTSSMVAALKILRVPSGRATSTSPGDTHHAVVLLLRSRLVGSVLGGVWVGLFFLALAGGLTAVGCGDDSPSDGAGGAGASGGAGGAGLPAARGVPAGSGGSGGTGGTGGEVPIETVPPSGTELIRVNQVGYLPAAAKVATVVAAADKPHAWELVDAGGTVVGSGATRVVGDDASSGEHVHTIDFSGFTTPGEGYTLRVGEVSSHPFDVGPTIYSR